MKYPKFIKKGSVIGVCAPSFGVPLDPYRIRYDNSKTFLYQNGIYVEESSSVYSLKKDESTNAKKRAKEFMDLYFNDEVDFVMSVAGGEVMCEILPFIKFDKIKKTEPKYFMGYSDNTVLTFALTTICDIATIYGPNAGDFGARYLDEPYINALKIMHGDIITQNSFDKYQTKSLKYEDYTAPLNLTKKVKWNCSRKNVTVKGRLIGGCLDVLCEFLGTPFDNVKNFNEKYKDDGFIWYMESCDLNSIQVKRALFQLDQAGWFKYVKGFIFGRPNNLDTPFNVSYKQAVNHILSKYKVPIIFDADFGHVHPAFTIINGAIGEIHYCNHEGYLKQYLE